MSDENAATDAELAEARALGWVDQTEWKGAPEQWADAKTFLEKGRHILPILKDRNDKLSAQLTADRARMLQLEAESKANKAALDALTEEREDAAEAQRIEEIATTEAEIERASREGDHAALAAATKKLVELNKAPEKKEEEKPAPDGKPKLDPLVQNWFLENPEYVTSPRKAALLQAISIEIRQDVNHPAHRAVGQEFLNACKKDVEQILGDGQPRKTSKVEDGAGGGAGGGSSGGNGKGYADLPAEAKAVCDRQATRFVGEGKRYKTTADWHKAYAAQYFKE